MLIETAEPAEIARQMSSHYCGKLRERLSERQMADLVSRVGEADRESRCASERYGVNSGELMLEAFAAVTGVDTKAEGFSIDVPFRGDVLTPRTLMNSAFWWNKRESYWPPKEEEAGPK